MLVALTRSLTKSTKKGERKEKGEIYLLLASILVVVDYRFTDDREWLSSGWPLILTNKVMTASSINNKQLFCRNSFALL